MIEVYIVPFSFMQSHEGTTENGFEPPFRELTTGEWVIPVSATDNIPTLALGGQGFEMRTITIEDFKASPA